jgi:Fe-S-cluster-containing hydrogenase component 2
MNGHLEIHAEACTGCRICESFCTVRHGGVIWPARARIRILAEGDQGPFTPNHCRQCDDAPCAGTCPAGAISLNSATGAWVVDAAICIGCGACVGACPYQAIFLDQERAVSIKCDLCDGQPECAQMCPSGAILARGSA